MNRWDDVIMSERSVKDRNPSESWEKLAGGYNC